MSDDDTKAAARGSELGAELGAVAEARCTCAGRVLSACPGEWEPGCDLGNNPAHVRAYQECAANGSGPCRIGPHGPRGEPQCEWCGEAPNCANQPQP